MNHEPSTATMVDISLSRIIYGAWRWDTHEPFQDSWGREIIETC